MQLSSTYSVLSVCRWQCNGVGLVSWAWGKLERLQEESKTNQVRVFNAARAGFYENSPSIFPNVFTIDLLLKFNGSQFHLENVNLLTLAVEAISIRGPFKYNLIK